MHELHQPRRNSEKCQIFKTLLSVPPPLGCLLLHQEKIMPVPNTVSLPSLPPLLPYAANRHSSVSIATLTLSTLLIPAQRSKSSAGLWAPMLPWQNLSAGVGSDVMVTGSVSTPSWAPTLTRCITSTIKILSCSQACNVSCPKSPTQQIKFSVTFLLSELQQKRESPENKKCLCNCASPHFCASSICNLCHFFAFSLPLPNCN